MDVKELNQEQLDVLKQKVYYASVDELGNYYIDDEILKDLDNSVSWWHIDNETIYKMFEIFDFVEEDFEINSEKIYLSRKQKEYIFESLYLIESFKEEILRDNWYIQECDFPENYVDDENIYPYQVVDEDIDYMIDCITKEFYEDIIEVE